jgi:hypothetical protein
MKRLILALGVSIFMMSCGEDPQLKVCECSKLYDDIRVEEEKLEESGIGGIDAMKKAREAHKEAFEVCESFHKELGDEKFYEMSQECK